MLTPTLTHTDTKADTKTITNTDTNTKKHIVATNQLMGTLPKDLAEKFSHLFPDDNSFFGILLSTDKLDAPF